MPHLHRLYIYKESYMRYRFLFISLLISLSACTYQVQMITPEPSLASEATAAQPTSLPQVETVTPSSL